MKKQFSSKKSVNRLFGAAMSLLFVSVYYFSTALMIQAQCTTAKRPLDFDGDGRTDFSVVRNIGGGAGGAITWFNSSAAAGFSATGWGISGDAFIPADYDGDGKTDIAVWRSGTQAYFYILQSGTSTFRSDPFGQTGDDPTVVGDYTGDGKADPAIYRGGANSGNPSFWCYRPSSGQFSGAVYINQWGQNGDFPAPGDYDGDGRYDFAVQRSVGAGAAVFYLNQTTDGNAAVRFGSPSDRAVPGYYDGDCKTDIAVVRSFGGLVNWLIRNSTNSALQSFTFGSSSTDFPVQGDYDGDGITDIAVWRSSATAGLSGFHWRNSTNGTNAYRQWGQSLDYPPANFNTH